VSFFFPRQSNFRLRFNIGRPLNPRWRFFWDFRTLYYKKGSARSNGRQMSRAQLFCSRVLPCVVTYSFDPQFRSADFWRRTVKIRHRALTEGKKNRISYYRARAYRCGQKVGQIYEILRRIEWIYRKLSSMRILLFLCVTLGWYRDNRKEILSRARKITRHIDFIGKYRKDQTN